MLSKAEILTEIDGGTLRISPFSPVQVKGASYVLRLGRRFRRWTRSETPIRLWAPEGAAEGLDDPIRTDVLRLEPGDLVLGCTLECLRLAPALAGVLSPLSHVARFGLGVTCGADLVNPGFGGVAQTQLTLELFNHNVRPLELQAGMPIAHLRLVRLNGVEATSAVHGIYDGGDPLTAPRFHEEWEPLLRGDGKNG